VLFSGALPIEGRATAREPYSIIANYYSSPRVGKDRKVAEDEQHDEQSYQQQFSRLLIESGAKKFCLHGSRPDRTSLPKQAAVMWSGE
jgi:hypothetical protein